MVGMLVALALKQSTNNQSELWLTATTSAPALPSRIGFGVSLPM